MNGAVLASTEFGYPNSLLALSGQASRFDIKMHGIVLTSNAFAVANADVASSLQATHLSVQMPLAVCACLSCNLSKH